MAVVHYTGTSEKARITTDKEFVNAICLSFWYQIYNNSYDCSLKVFKISGGNPTILFTANSNSTSLGTWINKSVDFYGGSPFRIALEADFAYRKNKSVRSILIDDTSIAFRPCQGQLMQTSCQQINTSITIDCETQFLNENITLTVQHENLISNQTNCQENYLESRINTYCRNFSESEKCSFRVLDLKNGREDCTVVNKNISVTYHCIDSSQTTINMDISSETPVQSGAIAAGVSGGVFLAMIAVCVIYRIKRSKPGKQKANSSKSNKAFDELQYDDNSLQKPTLSDSASQNKTTPTNSTLNKPEQFDQDGQESADLYNMSNEDGTYDVSGNERQRGNPNDNNIYSHTAEDMYDSGSHQNLPDRNEETYDHFFGQQTEDEYDTTART